MPLTKEADAARKRLARAKAKGVQLPTEAMPVQARLGKLAQIIATPLPKQKLTPSHILQAIDIYNKMTHAYTPELVSYTDNRQLNIYVNSDDGKAMLSTIMAGSRELPQTSTDVLPTDQPGEPAPAEHTYNNVADQGENNSTSVLPDSSEEGGVS